MTDKSIFEEIGGFEAIIAAVDIFYAKVMNDPLLEPFFKMMDMDAQQNKMVSFMAWAFGGPDEYKGRDLRIAHQGLVTSMGLTDAHFDAVATHLHSTLKELDVNHALIQRVLNLVGSTRDEVLSR
jgi:hemoglobin